jgi:hypothetical protein
MSLPTDYKERKALPIGTGVIDYFPDALAEVAHCSKVGNDQHNPGQALHWDKSKSQDEADALIRHFIQRGTRDSDGVRHSAKTAWRALALLQREIDAEERIAEATAKARVTDALVKMTERYINPPLVSHNVWVDKGDGKIVQETRVKPMFGRSLVDNILPDVVKLNTLTKRVLKRRVARKGRKS